MDETNTSNDLKEEHSDSNAKSKLNDKAGKSLADDSGTGKPTKFLTLGSPNVLEKYFHNSKLFL